MCLTPIIKTYYLYLLLLSENWTCIEFLFSAYANIGIKKKIY